MRTSRPREPEPASRRRVSRIPKGNQRCGDITAITPVNPRGATPTMVYGRFWTRSVLPTMSGSAPPEVQAAWLRMATGIALPGCSSSRRNARPRTIVTPNVEK